MKLNDTLRTGANEGSETITFYHVSTEVEAFKSFFREGAKSIGKGLGGQKDGFYVWTNKKASIRHCRFLNDFTKEFLVIGVTIPKKNIIYPLWQQDMELSQGIFRLWVKYSDFINKNGQNLNIPFDTPNKPFGWKFSSFSGFSCKKNYSTSLKTDFYNITFSGIDENGKGKQKTISRSEKMLHEDANGAEDSIKFQILTDWLCQNNPDLKKDYDTLMQKIMLDEKGTGLKYTGSEPLPITSAEYVKINEDRSFHKEVIFDAKKGKNQVCPFLKMSLVREK